MGQEGIDFILKFTQDSQNGNMESTLNVHWTLCSIVSAAKKKQNINGFAACASACFAQLSSLAWAANTETAVHTALVNHWGTDTCQLARTENAPSDWWIVLQD